MNDSTTQITNIRFRKDKDISDLYPDSPPVYYLELDLRDGEGNTMTYIFGEAAVSEANKNIAEYTHNQNQ